MNEIKENLLGMMRSLLNGEYDCNDFSYDFPETMLKLADEKWLKILDDMPEICAAYEPYEEPDEEVLNDEALKKAVSVIYNKIINELQNTQ